MSGTVTANLAENEHVKQLLEIFKENGMDADAKLLAEVVGHVMAVQYELNKTVGEVTAELSVLREERNHPVKTMLQKPPMG